MSFRPLVVAAVLLVAAQSAAQAQVSPRMTKISEYYDVGNYDAALTEIAALVADPNEVAFSKAYFTAWGAYIREAKGDNAACVTDARRATGMTGSLTEAQKTTVSALAGLSEGMCLVNQKENDAGLATLLKVEPVQDKLPGDALRARLHRFKAVVHERKSDWDSALKSTDQTLVWSPDWSFAKATGAYYEYKRENWAEAVARATPLVDAHGEQTWFREAHAKSLRMVGRFADALASLAVYDRVKDGATAWSEVERGYNHRGLDQDAEAEAAFTRAIALDAQYKWAYLGRAYARVDLDRDADALADVEQALRIDPEWIEALKERSDILQDMKDWTRSLSAADAWAAKAPDDKLVHWRRGYALSSLKRYEDSLAAYRRALEIDPSYAAAQTNIAVPLDNLKRYDELMVEAEKAVALQRTSTTLANLAIAFYRKGDKIKARDLINEAEPLDNKPENYATIKRIVLEEAAEQEKEIAEQAAQKGFDETIGPAQAKITAGQYEEGIALAEAELADPAIDSRYVAGLNELIAFGYAKWDKWCEAVPYARKSAPVNTQKNDDTIAQIAWACAQKERGVQDLAGELDAAALAIDAGIRSYQRVPRALQKDSFALQAMQTADWGYGQYKSGAWQTPAKFQPAVRYASLGDSGKRESLRRPMFETGAEKIDLAKAQGKKDPFVQWAEEIRTKAAGLPEEDKTFFKRLWPVVLDQLKEARGDEAALSGVDWTALKAIG